MAEKHGVYRLCVFDRNSSNMTLRALSGNLIVKIHGQETLGMNYLPYGLSLGNLSFCCVDKPVIFQMLWRFLFSNKLFANFNQRKKF
jgi:hypothetical protein